MESESDRQVLAELERSLRTSDPTLARQLGAYGPHPTCSRSRALAAALVAVAGLCLMVAGSANWVLLLTGTVLAGIGIALVTRNVRCWTVRLNRDLRPPRRRR